MHSAPLKKTLPAFLVCISAMPAAAAEFRFGLVGGPTFQKLNLASETKVSEGDVVAAKTKRKTGFSGGAALEWGFGDLGTLRLEPRYVQKGSSNDLTVRPRTGANLTRTVELKTEYVDVPLLYRSEFFKKKPTRLYLMSGIGPNFLVRAERDGSDIKSEFKSVELGVISSLGLIHRSGDKVIVGVDVRLSSSLTRIDKSTDPKAPKIRNTGIQVVASLIFPKK